MLLKYSFNLVNLRKCYLTLDKTSRSRGKALSHLRRFNSDQKTLQIPQCIVSTENKKAHNIINTAKKVSTIKINPLGKLEMIYMVK